MTTDRSGHAVPRLLNLQISFGLAGGAVWFAGAVLHHDFVSGIGVGLVAAAILLRVARVTEEDTAGAGAPATAEESGAGSE